MNENRSKLEIVRRKVAYYDLFIGDKRTYSSSDPNTLITETRSLALSKFFKMKAALDPQFSEPVLLFKLSQAGLANAILYDYTNIELHMREDVSSYIQIVQT